MFERFTERARKVVVLAQEEARRLGHDYIGTEHLLLGLLREDEGVAARVLTSLNVTLNEARERVEEMVGRGEGGTSEQPPFTPRSKKVLELALREALQLGHRYIGTEHILLGLLKEHAGVAARVLNALVADPDKVRLEVSRILSGRIGGMRPSTSWAQHANPASRRERPMAPGGKSSTFRARVDGLVVRARCGVTDEERATPQPLRVDLSYIYRAGEGDDLYGTVDYGALVEKVAELLEQEEFRLLETGTRTVGTHVLGSFPTVREVTVVLTKLQVPLDREVSGVSVEATFGR